MFITGERYSGIRIELNTQDRYIIEDGRIPGQDIVALNDIVDVYMNGMGVGHMLFYFFSPEFK